MRRAKAVWVVVSALVLAVAAPAAAQNRAVSRDSTAPDVRVPATALQPDSVVKMRKPNVGPRLPDVVPSVAMPAKPASPRGNIVIPVTTALIVLAALVVILLVT